VAAVVLACLSAFLFGAMSVGLRMGLRRHPDAELATLATVAGGLAVVLVAAAAEAPSRGVHAAASWPFFLTGALHPGLGMVLVILAVREAGASRSSVAFGAAPLVTVTIAVLLLGEPLSAPLLVGAVLIVAGGVELARERARPEHVRRLGLAFALGAVILFAVRDNLLRWLSQGTSAPPAAAGAAALLGGTLVIAALLGPRLRGRSVLAPSLPFLGVGVLFGLSYVALFEAYYRGRVTVVSPLIATESLWGVALSLLLIRQAELVGRRVVLGALLVVAGGVLIGIEAG
jgi:drug/metabolite transporter (DMT)-like permease